MARGRDRILDTAYDLFSEHGTRAVGVDRIITEAGAAKMTLYRNFASKEDLVLAFLEKREDDWIRGWFQTEVFRRADDPAGRLLAIFDVFDEWFEEDGFNGCPFLNVMLELPDRDDPVRIEIVAVLARVRGFLAELAAEAGVEDSEAFARQWHILMKGSIVQAAEGDRSAAARAREVGEILLSARAGGGLSPPL